jgi:hypothetical protein
MKLILALVFSVVSLQVQAGALKHILPGIIDGIVNPNRPAPYPGQPYPNPPSYGPVTCISADYSYEQHPGAHYSCGECLSYHYNCLETCRSYEVDCQVERRDFFGRSSVVYGRGYDQWQAQDDAVRNCRNQPLTASCRVMGCYQQSNIVSQRSCR